MPYAVTKAAQLQLVKCLAVSVGPKIRVNTVLPGLLLTEWVRFTLPLLTKDTYADEIRRASNTRKNASNTSNPQQHYSTKHS